jgi:hypothetical protein
LPEIDLANKGVWKLLVAAALTSARPIKIMLNTALVTRKLVIRIASLATHYAHCLS